MKREYDEDVEDDYDDPAYDPLVHQAARNPKKEKNMPRHMNMAAIMGALRSPKTPARLKKGLLKKYGSVLGKEKIPMSALATTIVKTNPKVKLKAKRIDIYVTEGPKSTYTIDYPAKQYTGVIKGLSKTKAFLKAAQGLEIFWHLT